MSMTCKACRSSGPHVIHLFREMMFGTRDEFEYFECNQCGSLQRLSQVADEGKFYPPNYYSFSEDRLSFKPRF